jgi:hypothetical protein
MSTHIASQDASKVIATTSQAVQKLLQEGVSIQAFQEIINNAEYRSRLASLMKRRGAASESWLFERHEEHIQAQDIMGDNFLGLIEVFQCFGALTYEQVKAFEKIPFSTDVLEKYSGTHLLVADIGLSMMGINRKRERNYYWRGPDGFWFQTEGFASESSDACWRLIPKDVSRCSIDRRYEDQLSLLGDDEMIPTVRTLAYATVLLHYLRGERMWQNIYVRTGTVPEYDPTRRVSIGFFGKVLSVNGSHFDKYFYCDVGIAPEIKPDLS